LDRMCTSLRKPQSERQCRKLFRKALVPRSGVRIRAVACARCTGTSLPLHRSCSGSPAMNTPGGVASKCDLGNSLWIHKQGGPDRETTAKSDAPVVEGTAIA